MANGSAFGGLLALAVTIPLIGITIEQISKIGDDVSFKQNQKEVKNAQT